MSLNCQIKNVEEWKATVDAISVIVEDAMFIVNHDGISFRGTDPSHIALLDITFPKSSFEKFEATTSFFGIRIDDLKNVINSAGNNDIIDLKIDDKNLQVSISGSLKMDYKMSVLNKSDTNIPVPKCTYKSKISIQPSTLTRIVTNLEKISDSVSISSSTKKVEFSGKGDSGDVKINIDTKNPDLLHLDSPEGINSIYSLEYMAKVIRSIGKVSRTVNIEYDTQKPIRLDFEMPSTTKIQYYLAPRVQ